MYNALSKSSFKSISEFMLKIRHKIISLKSYLSDVKIILWLIINQLVYVLEHFPINYCGREDNSFTANVEICLLGGKGRWKEYPDWCYPKWQSSSKQFSISNKTFSIFVFSRLSLISNFLNNSFIVAQLTYYSIHPFNRYHSVVINKFGAVQSLPQSSL